MGLSRGRSSGWSCRWASRGRLWAVPWTRVALRAFPPGTWRSIHIGHAHLPFRGRTLALAGFLAAEIHPQEAKSCPKTSVAPVHPASAEIPVEVKSRPKASAAPLCPARESHCPFLQDEEARSAEGQHRRAPGFQGGGTDLSILICFQALLASVSRSEPMSSRCLFTCSVVAPPDAALSNDS